MLFCCSRFARAMPPSWALNVLYEDRAGAETLQNPQGSNFLSCRSDWSTQGANANTLKLCLALKAS